jgi:hypothetical protein
MKPVFIFAYLFLATTSGMHSDSRADIVVDFSRVDMARQLQADTPNLETRTIDGRTLHYLPPSQDPYTEAAWPILLPSLESFAGQAITLELHFHDAGAGVIDASLNTSDNGALSPVRKRGYTRCNTGAERLAAFAFALPATAPSPGHRSCGCQGSQYPLRVWT